MATVKTVRKTRRPSLKFEINGKKVKQKTLTEIIKLVFDGEKLKAIKILRDDFRDLSLHDAVEKLAQFWYNDFQEYIKTYPDVINKFIPHKCCLNCVGLCGKATRQKHIESGIYNADVNKFKGNDCAVFKTQQELQEICQSEQLTVTVAQKYSALYLYKDSALCKILKVYNPDSQLSKIVGLKKTSIYTHIMSMINRNFNIHTIEPNNTAVALTINDTPAKYGESYKKYCETIQQKIRELKQERQNQYDNMSYEEIIEKLTDKFIEAGMQEVIESYSCLEDMLSDFYPEKTPKNILMSLEV